MDHPTCDLYINFLGIQARSQACLYTEKIQVILEINHDIVLKSIIFVLILNEHVMQIKQSSEELIYRTDFNIQRARWRVFKYFSWSISLQKKQIISIKCCIRLKKFLTQRPFREIQSIISCQWLALFYELCNSLTHSKNLNFYWYHFKLWVTFDNSEENGFFAIKKKTLITVKIVCLSCNMWKMGSSFIQEVDFWQKCL